MQALDKNYKLWYNEYNVINQKLLLRDRKKEQVDQVEQKIQNLQSEKYQHQNRGAERQQDIDNKILIMEKQISTVQKEMEYQNKTTFEIMDELVNKKETMLNPVLTKFIQVNAILYSKSYLNFSNVGAIDPNRGLINKMIDKPDQIPLANIGGQRGITQEKKKVQVDKFTAK